MGLIALITSSFHWYAFTLLNWPFNYKFCEVHLNISKDLGFSPQEPRGRELTEHIYNLDKIIQVLKARTEQAKSVSTEAQAKILTPGVKSPVLEAFKR